MSDDGVKYVFQEDAILKSGRGWRLGFPHLQRQLNIIR